MCHPEYAGGLGVRQIHLWSSDALGRYVWAISAKKDNLWIKCVNEVYVKERSWWEYQPSINCSWYRRKIFEMKEMLKVVINEHNLSSVEKYSVNNMYKKLVGDFERIHWDKQVWNRFVIPKHRFVAWLIMSGSLQTTEWLHKIGVTRTSQYIMCNVAEEILELLFFTCQLNKLVLDKIKCWLNMRNACIYLPTLLSWISRCTSSKMMKQIFVTAILASVYSIWWNK